MKSVCIFWKISPACGNQLVKPCALNVIAGASQALDNTAATMFDLKGNLSSRRMQSLQDNQAREAHHDAMAKLRDAERVSCFLSP